MKFLIAFIWLPFGSCIMHYDALQYYKAGYSPNNNGFRVDGYYYMYTGDENQVSLWDSLDSIAPLTPMYFYLDGTWKGAARYPRMDILETYLCNEEKPIYGPWGFYKIQNDTLLVEYIVTDPMGDMNATRNEFKAIMTDTSINIFARNHMPADEVWLFKPYHCKPDSSRNWIVNHKKYRIEE